VLPKADALIEKMHLDVRYKDMTFEKLNRGDFLEAIKSLSGCRLGQAIQGVSGSGREADVEACLAAPG
jgi:hypothetical protein